jgi:hypothetical protein
VIQKTELSGAEKVEVAPSTRDFSKPFGLSSESKVSQPPQTEAAASPLGAGVDPQRQFSAQPSAEGIKDIETQQNLGVQVVEASIGKGIEREGDRQFLIS